MKARLVPETILIAIALLALGGVQSVLAKGLTPYAPTVPTIIELDPLPTFAIGDQPVVVAHLKNVSGAPLANRMVRLFAYKNRVAEGITDSTGTARIPLNWNFYPGDYKLLITFNGSTLDHLDSTFTTKMLTIVPGTLRVQTVPALAGVQFKLGDQMQTTDASGLVQFSIDHNGGYHIEVVPPAPAPNDNVRILFDRWNDNDVSQYHEFKFPTHRVIQAGFLLSYPVNLKYADKANLPVDAGRIAFARVRTAGTFYTLTDPSHAWLPNNSILHRVGGVLESKPALYYLDNVTISGANVVNQGQQRFQVGRDSTWRIELFLYPASFSAKDALFRFPVGSGILLEFPDGTQQQLVFPGSDASIQVPSLPRGIYHASVQGARGLEPRIPLSLSRARGFELIVISRLDLAVLLGVPAAVALLFLVIGRTPVLAWLTPRKRGREPETGSVSS